MKKSILCFYIIVCAITYIIIGVLVFLWFFDKDNSIKDDREYVQIEELQDYFVRNINIIRFVTECNDFPDYEARKLWYHRIDGYHTEPHIECFFKREMTKEEFIKLSKITHNIYWRVDKDGTLRFSRGWSQKEFMEIPVGMMENMLVRIEKLSQSGFTLSYRDNVKGERIDGDFLNKLTGKTFPAYSVVDYNNDGVRIYAQLQFENLVDTGTINELLASDSLDIKFDTVLNNKRFFFSMPKNEKLAILKIRDDVPVCGNSIKYIDE